MKINIKIICALVFTIGVQSLQAQQLLRYQFNAGVTTNANGTFIIGEPFNKTTEVGTTVIAESILYQFANETLSIPTIDENEDIYIYPNPVESVLNIRSNFQSNMNITIFDSTGKTVFDELYQSTLDLQFLASGMYVLKILDNDKQHLYNFKFIKK